MRIIMRMSHPPESVMATAKKYKVPAVKPLLAEEPRVIYNTGKQRLNITVRGDLIERARAAKLNLSSVLEESLERTLRMAEAKQWAVENAEAIAYHNARIERDGMWNRDLIRF